MRRYHENQKTEHRLPATRGMRPPGNSWGDCFLEHPRRELVLKQIVVPGWQREERNNHSVADFQATYPDTGRLCMECTKTKGKLETAQACQCIDSRKLYTVMGLPKDTSNSLCKLVLEYSESRNRPTAMKYTLSIHRIQKTFDPTFTDSRMMLRLPIEDALQFGRRLGIPYLLLEGCCIAQGDPVARYEQVKHMHEIYKSAYVTFVAGAGNSPQTGLPDISTRQREEQIYTGTDKHRLVRVPGVVRDVQECPWSTTGWTFQKKYFSKRLLTFTENQMFSQCGSMYCNVINPTRLNGAPKKDFNHIFRVFLEKWKHLRTFFRNTISEITHSPCISFRMIHEQIVKLEDFEEILGSNSSHSFSQPCIWLDEWVTTVMFVENFSGRKTFLIFRDKLSTSAHKVSVIADVKTSTILRQRLCGQPLPILESDNSPLCERDEASTADGWSNVCGMILQERPNKRHTRMGVVTWSSLSCPMFDTIHGSMRVNENVKMRQVFLKRKYGSNVQNINKPRPRSRRRHS